MKALSRSKKAKPNWEVLLTAEAESEMKRVGQLLADARKLRKMSVVELAVRVGVDRRTLGRLEKGSPKVSLGIFFQVLSALGLLRGIEEALNPENDLEAISAAVRRVRGRRKSGKVIDDELVKF